MNLPICSFVVRWVTFAVLLVSMSLPIGAQVIFDSAEQLFADQDATLSITAFPVGAGDNRLLVVHFLGSNFPTAVTFDGNTMDVHVTNQFWYMVLGSGAGITGDISLTFPDTTTGSLIAFSCLGVSQTDPLGSVSSATSFSGTNTLNISSDVGSLVVDIISNANYGFGCMMPDLTVGSGQIQKVNEVASLNGLGGVCAGVGLSVEEGAASVEMSWDIINGGSGDYFSFNVQQVAPPNNVGIGTASPHPSARLDVVSADQGVLVPRLDSMQRLAILSPATGLVLYDTDADGFYFYNGSSWTRLVSGTSDDADADPANELQILSISNDTLFLSDGGFAKLSYAILQDIDGDTKIQVEESPDEDIIRFDIGGTEFGSMNGKTFSLSAPGNSLFIGDGAGVQDDSTGNVNTFIGIGAGSYTTSGEGNTFLGFQAGQSNIIGSLNTIIGTNAGLQLTEGGQNTFIGAQAGINNLNSTNTMIGVSTGYQNNGYNNLFMGAGAAAGNAGGYQNTILGNESGENSDGSNNVFLGFRAGYNQTGDNRLVIESSEADSTNALIYGEFDNDLLRINGYLSTYRLAIGDSFSGAETTPENGAIVEGRVGIGTSTPDTSAMLDIASVDKGILIPRTDTTAVNAAGVPATGLLIYQNTNNLFYYFNGANWRLIGEDVIFEIRDIDGDTKIQVEESPDEDIIRFDIRGNQAMMIDSTGNVGIGTSTPDTSAMLDISAVDKGILIPRTDTTAVNAAGVPATGLLIYQNTNNKFYYFNGTNWRVVGEEPSYELKDFDGDTKIQMEESPDEDIIRFDIRGSQAMMIDSTGNVGIGTSTPTSALHVNGDIATVSNGLIHTWSGAANFSHKNFPYGFGQNSSGHTFIHAGNTSGNIYMRTGGDIDRLTINNAGSIIGARAATFNEEGGNFDFRVESDVNPNMLFVDASTNRVGIGTAGPTTPLEVNGNISTTAGGLIHTYDGPVFSHKNYAFGFGQSALGNTSIHAGDVNNGYIYMRTGGNVDRLTISNTGTIIGARAAIFNEEGGDYDFRVESDGNTGMLFVDASTNRVGIGTLSPTATLEVRPSYGGSDGIEIHAQNTSRWNINTFTSTDNDLGFFYNGTYKGYLDEATNVGALDFTAQHRNFPAEGTVLDYTDKVGLIVSSNGALYNLDGSILPKVSESLPYVHVSDKPYDKSIYGVIAGIEDPNDPKDQKSRSYSQGLFATSIERVDENDYRLIINSAGEGGVWVSNYGGNIENGDLVTTSPISGIGMKQDDDLIRNYTVAKIVMDCDFDLDAKNYECKEVMHNGKSYRMAFLACVYKCN